jgi:hypothetical protein
MMAASASRVRVAIASLALLLIAVQATVRAADDPKGQQPPRVAGDDDDDSALDPVEPDSRLSACRRACGYQSLGARSV